MLGKEEGKNKYPKVMLVLIYQTDCRLLYNPGRLKFYFLQLNFSINTIISFLAEETFLLGDLTIRI